MDEKTGIYNFYKFRGLGETFFVSNVYKDTKTQRKWTHMGVRTGLFGDASDSGQCL